MLLPLKAIISKYVRKDGKAVIYYQYCFSSENRVQLDTEIAIPPSFWNAKRQRISQSLPEEFGNVDDLNNEINRLKKIIEGIIEHGIAIGEPNMGEYVKGLFNPSFKLDTLKKNPLIVPLIKREPDFFKELENYVTSKERKVKGKGIANFKSLQARLQAFEDHRKKKITFSGLDYNFYTELVEFLTYDYVLKRKVVTEYGLKTSTMGCTIKKLRGFIKDRVRRKIIAPIDMDDFKIMDEESDAIYLTYEEIGKIYALDLNTDKVLEMYRDVFVLGCLTGLRFSDYSTLRGSDLRGSLLYKKTEKKDKWVIIPLRTEAIEIFEKHFTDAVPTISNPVFNRYIKDIGVLANITQLITFSYKKGNKNIEETKPKAAWITSHTCRRSFATNEYLAGTDISLIMKITGHKTHKDFFKYIRVTQEEAARQIQGIWELRNNMAAFGLRAVG